MSIRDELAKDIFISDNCRALDPEREWEEFIGKHKGVDTYAHAIADGLLERGWMRATGEQYAVKRAGVTWVFNDRSVAERELDRFPGEGEMSARKISDWEEEKA